MRKTVLILVAILAALFALLVIAQTVTIDDATNSSEVTGIEAAKENLAAITNDKDPIATIVLTMDDVDYTFTFELFPDKAPESVNNFISLANSGFYDGLTMHRLVQDFVLQGGDPLGNGSGGPDYTIKGEFPSNGVETGLTHQVGSIAWARSQNNDTAGSQFYIVLNDGVQSLDENYAVFGYMVEGYENLQIFNDAPTATGDVPVSPITIKSASVDTKGIKYNEPNKIEDYQNLDDNHDEE